MEVKGPPLVSLRNPFRNRFQFPSLTLEEFQVCSKVIVKIDLSRSNVHSCPMNIRLACEDREDRCMKKRAARGGPVYVAPVTDAGGSTIGWAHDFITENADEDSNM